MFSSKMMRPGRLDPRIVNRLPGVVEDWDHPVISGHGNAGPGPSLRDVDETRTTLHVNRPSSVRGSGSRPILTILVVSHPAWVFPEGRITPGNPIRSMMGIVGPGPGN